MKQQITIEQFNKLSGEHKELLNEWRQVNDEFASAPLLTIGQMIQFIQEKKPLLKGIVKARFNKWTVNIETATLGYKDELCDALWDATVQILKNP